MSQKDLFCFRAGRPFESTESMLEVVPTGWVISLCHVFWCSLYWAIWYPEPEACFLYRIAQMVLEEGFVDTCKNFWLWEISSQIGFSVR